MILKADVWNDNHKYEMRRQDTEKKEVVGLWCVIVSTPHKGVETHYVLSYSEKDAIGMAECAAGVESYSTSSEIYNLVKCHATRLPLTVQGWGKAKF